MPGWDAKLIGASVDMKNPIPDGVSSVVFGLPQKRGAGLGQLAISLGSMAAYVLAFRLASNYAGLYGGCGTGRATLQFICGLWAMVAVVFATLGAIFYVPFGWSGSYRMAARYLLAGALPLSVIWCIDYVAALPQGSKLQVWLMNL